MPFEKAKGKDKERECNCCIEIKDSLVVLVCGEVDIDRLKDSIKTFVELKGNAKLASQE